MNRKTVFVLLAIFLLTSGSLIAQNNSLNYSVSPEFGLFASLEDDQLGLIGGMEASMMKQKWVASTHYYYGQECTLLSSGPSRHFNQASLLIGRSKSFSSFRFDYQAGFAAIWGIRHSKYYNEGFFNGHHETESYVVPGLILEVGMDYLASKYFGLGTQLNVNLNTELPMIQVALCFSFGKLK
jgi:hypothetical protein